jgi:predicted RNase H-like HicB family nuclease
MVSYPVELVRDADGGFRGISPHFPELTAHGWNEDDALMHARFALEAVVGERIAKQEVVPVPIKSAPSQRKVSLANSVIALLERYWRYNLGSNLPEHRP